MTEGHIILLTLCGMLLILAAAVAGMCLISLKYKNIRALDDQAAGNEIRIHTHRIDEDLRRERRLDEYRNERVNKQIGEKYLPAGQNGPGNHI